MTTRFASALATLVFGIAVAFQASAGTPVTEDGVTTIHLDQYNG
ncbi:hypothetical protein [Wenzhouxiangella sp. AB-CW3]|nr:hypothetical protein [Wenzhouxiangella sp. AB-CW3]